MSATVKNLFWVYSTLAALIPPHLIDVACFLSRHPRIGGTGPLYLRRLVCRLGPGLFLLPPRQGVEIAVRLSHPSSGRPSVFKSLAVASQPRHRHMTG